jgi:hypothetical protein
MTSPQRAPSARLALELRVFYASSRRRSRVWGASASHLWMEQRPRLWLRERAGQSFA